MMSSHVMNRGYGASRLPRLWSAPRLIEPAAAQEGVRGVSAVHRRSGLWWQGYSTGDMCCQYQQYQLQSALGAELYA